jgi:hypothetical protein
MSPRLTLTAMFGLSLIGLGQSRDGESTSKSFDAPAFYDGGGAFLNEQKLVLLPAGAKPVTMPLPFGLTYIALSPDGKALYSQRFFDPTGPNSGLYKIEFGPTRASRVAGSEVSPRPMALGRRRPKSSFRRAT